MFGHANCNPLNTYPYYDCPNNDPITSRFSRNSEANASEFIENLEEVWSEYHTYGNMSIAGLNFKSHHSVLPAAKKVKILAAYT